MVTEHQIFFEAYTDKVDAFHLYTSNGHTLSADDLKQICANNKIVWGYNTAPENIKETLANYKPYALNIIGGDEEKTGLKDFEELNNTLDALGLYEA